LLLFFKKEVLPALPAADEGRGQDFVRVFGTYASAAG
jgi:hypothetical protein